MASVAELLRVELLAQKLDPHQDMAALMLGQIAWETDHGRKCDNHNVGNVSANELAAVDYFRPLWFAEGQTDPRLAALHAAMLSHQAPRAFRAYPGFVEGVAGYVRAAKQLGVIAAARTGDAETLANVIRLQGYTPGAPASLGRTLEQLRNDYLGREYFASLPKDHGGAPPNPGQVYY